MRITQLETSLKQAQASQSHALNDNNEAAHKQQMQQVVSEVRYLKCICRCWSSGFVLYMLIHVSLYTIIEYEIVAKDSFTGDNTR